MEPAPQHPSRPLLHPLMWRATRAIGEAFVDSEMPDEDLKKLFLMIEQFHATLSEVIELLDPSGEKLCQYQHLLDVEYFDKHHKERLSGSLEAFWENPEPDQPTTAEPPSTKFKAAAQPPKRAGKPRKEAPARRHTRRRPRGNQGIKTPRHHRRPRENE